MGLERWSRVLAILQRTQVLFSAPTSDGSQLLVTPVLKNTMSLGSYPHVVFLHTLRHTHIHTK